jgi:hypothetical protein
MCSVVNLSCVLTGREKRLCSAAQCGRLPEYYTIYMSSIAAVQALQSPPPFPRSFVDSSERQIRAEQDRVTYLILFIVFRVESTTLFSRFLVS